MVEDEAAIPLAEERLVVSKRPVERRVRIRTVTENVPVAFTEELRAERVEVQRFAVDRELTEPPEIRVDGEVTIIPVVEERLVLEKRLYLVEEVHVRRIAGTETIQQPVVLRKQRVVVDRRESSGDTEED